jgi:hypothetical protein
MFTTIVVLFAVVLLVLAVAATRGLLRIDEILEVVDPDDLDSTSARSLDRAER